MGDTNIFFKNRCHDFDSIFYSTDLDYDKTIGLSHILEQILFMGPFNVTNCQSNFLKNNLDYVGLILNSIFIEMEKTILLRNVFEKFD